VINAKFQSPALEIPFKISVPSKELESVLEELLGKTLMPKTDVREAHYHRNFKVAIEEGIEIKQIIHIRETVEIVPIPTVDFIVNYAKDMTGDRTVDYVVDVVGTYLAVKLAKWAKAKLQIGGKDVPIDKDKIVKAFLDVIQRLREKLKN